MENAKLGFKNAEFFWQRRNSAFFSGKSEALLKLTPETLVPE